MGLLSLACDKKCQWNHAAVRALRPALPGGDMAPSPLPDNPLILHMH
jgi:hypothetical protein